MALDRIGDRWTLLIVCELLSGPKRFADLLNGLPCIPTNLLAKRPLRRIQPSRTRSQRWARRCRRLCRP